MKREVISDIDQLIDLLQQDRAWRLQELASVVSSLESSNVNEYSYVRVGITLLYAHWEGFIKYAAECYAKYVAGCDVDFSSLSPPLFAMELRRRVNAMGRKRNISDFINLCIFVREGCDSKCETDLCNEVTSRDYLRGNLRSHVLKEIIFSLGLDYTPFAYYRNLIDKQLVDERNLIAHGHYVETDKQAFGYLRARVIILMEQFMIQIIDAADKNVHLN